MKIVYSPNKTWKDVQDLINAYLLTCAVNGWSPLPGKSVNDVVKDLKELQVADTGTDDSDRPHILGHSVLLPEENPYLAR